MIYKIDGKEVRIKTSGLLNGKCNCRYDLTLTEDINNYNKKEIKEYTKENNIQIAKSIGLALAYRRRGKRVVSIREADILSRGNVNLTGNFLFKTMFYIDGLIKETHEVFILRERINNGIFFFSNLKKQIEKDGGLTESTKNKAIKGKERLDGLYKELELYKVPARELEAKIGFNPEFLKPEFVRMEDWNEYKKNRREQPNPESFG